MQAAQKFDFTKMIANCGNLLWRIRLQIFFLLSLAVFLKLVLNMPQLLSQHKPKAQQLEATLDLDIHHDIVEEQKDSLVQHVHHKHSRTNRTTIAIGCAITTRGQDFLTLENVPYRLPLLKTLLPTFCRTASKGYSYHFYIAFDMQDPYLMREEYLRAVYDRFAELTRELCTEESSYELHFVQCHHDKSPTWAQNDAMMEAYLDEVDFYYRVNDDTQLITPAWTESFISHLENSDPPLVGVVAPMHSGGNTAILTYDFLHKTHINIFGFYYPRVFTDWWADNWMSHVYGKERTQKLPNVRVFHTMEAGTRYRVQADVGYVVEYQLKEDQATLARYIQSVRNPRPTSQSVRVISMSLWGSAPRYTYGALRNAQLVPVYMPGWRLRIYVEDPTAPRHPLVPPRILNKLQSLGVELVYVSQTRIPPMMWRFLVADDLSVDYFIVRDSDARLTDRDAAVVEDWIQSGSMFHCIRDHPSHAGYSLLGGLWGAQPKNLSKIMASKWENLMMGYTTEYTMDMKFLANAIWPKVEYLAYCHDSVSCQAWHGAHPFPVSRIGAEHIGQVFDAFGNARQGDVKLLEEAPVVLECLPKKTEAAAVPLSTAQPGKAVEPPEVPLENAGLPTIAGSTPGTRVIQGDAGAPIWLQVNTKAPGITDVPVKSPGIADVPVKSPGIPDVPMKSPGIPDVPVKSSGISDVPVKSLGIPDVPVKSPGILDVPLKSPGIPDVPLKSPGISDVPVKSPGISDVPLKSPGITDVPVKSPGISDVPLKSPVISNVPLKSPGIADIPGMLQDNDEGPSLAHEQDEASEHSQSDAVVWSIDYDISTLRDIQHILESADIKVLSHSLSARCHVTHNCANNLRVISKTNGIDLKQSVIQQFFTEYQHDPIMNLVTHYFCTLPASLCELYIPFDKPIIVYISHRYEMGRYSKTRWQTWNNNLKMIAKKPGNFVVANNRYDAEYVEYFTGIKLRVVPSVCNYVTAQYTPTNTSILLAATHSPIFQDQLLGAIQMITQTSMMSLSVRPVSEVYPKGFYFRDIAAHPAVIHIPYQAYTEELCQHYAMNIPIFVPSVRLLAQWHLKYNILSAFTFNTVRALLKESPIAGYYAGPDPNNQTDIESLHHWLQYADHYQKPHIVQFDSIKDLLTKLTTSDLSHISQNMAEFNKVTSQNVYEDWKHMIYGM